MKVRKFHLKALYLIPILAAGCAQFSIKVPEVTDSDFEASYRNDLMTLASDEFQGRRPGTPGGEKTIDYLVESFKAMGVEPGNNGSYLQEVKLKSSKTLPTTNTIVVSDNDSLTLEPLTHIIASVIGEESILVLLDNELVFVGYGAVSEDDEWDDYSELDVEGKVVVMLRNHPGFASEDTTFFQTPAAARNWLFSVKFNNAKTNGALGAIVIIDTALSTSKSKWERFAQRSKRGSSSLADAVVDTSKMKLQAMIDLGVGKELLALAGYDYDSLKVAAFTPGFKGFDLGLRISGEFTREEELYSSNNVLGLIRGTKRPDEVIIYTAHWDHLGILEGAEGDSIYNGASDNSTGTASILNLARAFSSLPNRPERSILFMGYTAEEMGLLGSKYYGDNPVYPLGKSVANINIDMLNFMGETNDLIVFGMGKSDLDDYAARAAKKIGMRLQEDLWPEEGYYYRSDHISLARKGLPALSMDNGVDSREHGQEWGLAYFKAFVDSNYHKLSDEYSDDLNVDGIMQYLQVVFDIGYTLANSSKFPNWNKDDEFRALRDASRAEAESMHSAP
ncbi:MAG: M28 family peptidase [Candidatus Marinimicrobia bacterium]|nr:M28 family peptidase [Candidatus Neomarinimicrobiota bacterium]